MIHHSGRVFVLGLIMTHEAANNSSLRMGFCVRAHDDARAS